MKLTSTASTLKHLLAAAALAAFTLQAQAVVGVPSAFTGVYVFGDSLSDGGNNRLVLGGSGAGQTITGNSYIPTFPYASSTYSNGPVWFNTFAAGLGLASFATPSLAGGGNNAYGGARTTFDGGFPPSTRTQLNGFLGSNGVSANAIYVLASGGNDVRDVATAFGSSGNPAVVAAGAQAYATATAGMVSSLVAAGATPKNIVVWNVPNVGLAPATLALGALASGGATFVSSSFNTALGSALATSGVTMFDVFGLVGAAAASGQFTNLTDACGAAVNNCNPATALFWDGIHPTAAAQAFVGNRMLAAVVPEPAAVWMFMAGLVAVSGMRLRRR
ncbi:MAG: SGNH/GDSL hydrolase family protein [Rubrivivax sp.]